MGSYQNLRFGSYQNPNINQIGNQKIGGPVALNWDIETQSLYFVNLENRANEPVLYRYSYDEDTLYMGYLPGYTSLSFISPTKLNSRTFVVGADKRALIIDWDGFSTNATIVRNSFPLGVNDPSAITGYGCTEPRGRYFGGVFSKAYCSNTTDFSPYPVYRYDRQNGLTRVIHGAYTVGIVFNPETRKMYHLAPCRSLITEYDWDPETGDICMFEI